MCEAGGLKSCLDSSVGFFLACHPHKCCLLAFSQSHLCPADGGWEGKPQEDFCLSCHVPRTWHGADTRSLQTE